MNIVVEHIVSFIVRRRPKTYAGIMHRVRLAPGVFLCLFPLAVAAQTDDTVRRETLGEVTISGQRTPTVLRTATPTQVMDADHIEHLGAVQLSDAVRQMAGVTLKDYGGVGGVKTVSARGLGSQFSAVTIDGVPVDDSQNGQVDLGRYTLGNSAYVSLSQGQEQSTLLSARAMAAGNVLNMETAEPSFWPGERTKLRAGVEGGSFGYLSPTLLWQERWSSRLRSTLYANYIRSSGDYPFTLYYTASHQDSSSRERRQHSAVWMLTVDGNLFATLGEGNTLTTKVHLLRGAHELPGPVAFYSQTVPEQYSTEELAFVQTRWRVVRQRWQMQLLGKVRYSFDDYTDTTPGNNIYNSYRQREAYLSGSLDRSLAHWIDLDVAVDASLSHLGSNLEKRNEVTRSNLTAVAALHAWWLLGTTRLDLRANMLLTDVRDRVVDLDTMPTYHRLSPHVAAMLNLGQGTTLRAFYKQTYRAPNFGELYFFQLVPRNLMPEQAHQANLGVTHAGEVLVGEQSLQLSATLDAYYNHVKDKIVAKPTNNMYYWSMQNLGLVDIVGVDATARLQAASLTLDLHYTYQHAVDHSQKGSKTYGHQIVYTPRHSGGASARWESRWVNLGATAMVVGKRYSGPQNTDRNRLPAYCDVGLSADRRFDLPHGALTLRAQILNLLDEQYEVVASYPMMGRNWRLALTYDF